MSTPYTVIGGYLGAGKTTLLNHLVRRAGGMRLAIVVNDFGDVDIDGDLVRAADGDTMSLVNGCICCSLADGLAGVLEQLRERGDGLDHVVVEASGVSDPVRIGQYAAPFGFVLHGVIVVADAEQVRERAEDRFVGDAVRRHLRTADLVVLNKVDLLDPDERLAVHRWLDDVAPAVHRIDAVRGVVPLPLVLGVLDPPEEVEDAGGEVTPPGLGGASTGGVSHPDHDTWSFTSSEPIGREALRGFLADLPEGVVRVKGFVLLTDEPDRAALVQVVGRRWSITDAGPWVGRPATRLVAVGRPGAIDRTALTAALVAAGQASATLAPPAGGR